MLGNDLQTFLTEVPPVSHAFAYGSGVFEQIGAPASKDRQVDVILVVDSPECWHSDNLQKNPEHYSSILRRFGSQAVVWNAENIGVGLHFNPYVRWRHLLLKYGVVSHAHVLADLTGWWHLYIGGRMHKPVFHLKEDDRLQQANGVNLQSALGAALLQLGENFTEAQLHTTLCGLSYQGDMRMGIAEDKGKVSRLAASNPALLRELYAPHINHLLGQTHDVLHKSADGSKFTQDMSDVGRTGLVSSLPPGLMCALAVHCKVPHAPLPPAFHPTTHPDLARQVSEAVLQSSGGMRDKMAAALRSVVAVSSKRQALAGVLAAGGLNSLRYLSSKIEKAWKT